MTSTPDNFESLEKLLKLKRYEQPPPRFFNEFSGRVLSRIDAGEGRSSLWEQFGFDLRPAFAAAAGMLACGLVVYGVATSDTGPDFSSTVTGYADTSAALLEPPTLRPRAGSGNSTALVSDYGAPQDRKVFGAEVLRTSFEPR
jgi:hypothetical protein